MVGWRNGYRVVQWAGVTSPEGCGDLTQALPPAVVGGSDASGDLARARVQGELIGRAERGLFGQGELQEPREGGWEGEGWEAGQGVWLSGWMAIMMCSGLECLRQKAVGI